MPAYSKALFWFRRDLRDADNAGLHHALKSASRVYCVFVFDREILDALPSRRDRRVEFIQRSVRMLKDALRRRGGDLIVLHQRARDAIPSLARKLEAEVVFANGDYEPGTIARDEAISEALAAEGRRLNLAKDQAIFEKDEVMTQAGRPFTVFAPYKRAWLAQLEDRDTEAFDARAVMPRLATAEFPAPMPSLEDIGFEATDLLEIGILPGMEGARTVLADFARRIPNYGQARDFPAVKGVSCLSVHNRFGTVSIRALARLARASPGVGHATWLSELIWRDFYFQILWHFPRVVGESFRAEYASLEWPGNDAHFEAWRSGRTGYPLVDAAMRQLNATGYMHNRLRMVAASFLTKDLLVDWRRGEAVFAERLNDFDLAANNGGWQWAASTGCDAQPYFRIFNPVTQSERFDARGEFIRRYVPELCRVSDRRIHAPWTMDASEQQATGCTVGRDYPAPIVDHAAQRVKALALYKRGS